MKNRIVYLNTFGWGNGHEMFNAGLLAMCAQAVQGGRVLCRATKSNFEAMAKLLSQHGTDCRNIKFRPLFTVGGEGRYALLGRYVWGVLLSVWYLLLSKKTDLIVIPFNNLFALKHINRLNRWLRRPVVICCHGELEFLVSDINKRGMLSVQLYNRCRNFFLNRKVQVSEGLFFSVLGDKIRENLKECLPPHIWSRFLVMDHPYFFHTARKPAIEPDRHRTLRLGTCGAMSLSKGVLDMALFARNCRAADLDVSITHIGRVLAGEQELRESGVHLPSSARELPREEYDRRVRELDFLLFFYPKESYRVTASGAIMDAIALRKPVIAIRNDYFDYMFEKFGVPGMLVDSVEQMSETVEKICRDDMAPIASDYEAIQRKLTPEALIGQLHLIMERALSAH